MRQSFRNLARSVLSRLNLGVFRLESAELYNFSNILFLLLNKEGHVRYLQIGANDGIMFDPMYEFVVRNHYRVSGLLVEPVEIYYQKLQKNYSKFSQITAVHRAIHNSEKSMKMFVARETSVGKRKTHINGMSSFSKIHLMQYGLLAETDIDEINVQCSSVAELLQEYEFLDINLLVIDTEGYDFQILEKLDLDVIRPKVVRFEHGLAARTMTSIELQYLCDKFNRFGYQVSIVNNDAIAIQTNFLISCLD